MSFKIAVGSLCRTNQDCKADIRSRLGLPRLQGVTVGMAFEVAVGLLAGHTKITRLVTSRCWAYTASDINRLSSLRSRRVSIGTATEAQ